MSYDETLAARLRTLLAAHESVVEKKMFGGVCFMVSGAMCCGVLGVDLIVRVGVDKYGAALARPCARPFDFTGKPSKGMVYVSPEGIRDGASLASWVRRALAVVDNGPSKTSKESGRAEVRSTRAADRTTSGPTRRRAPTRTHRRR